MGDKEAEDEDDSLVSLTSRLKLCIQSECSRQSVPCLNGHNLHFELEELIMAHLPVLKLAELKVVSKLWKVLLQTTQFKELWQSIRGGCDSDNLDVWVMKSTNEQEDLMAFIPSMKKFGVFLQLICNPLVLTDSIFGLQLMEQKLLCGSEPFLLAGDEDWQRNGSFIMYNLQTCRSQRLIKIQEDFPCILRPPVLITGAENPSQFCLLVETGGSVRGTVGSCHSSATASRILYAEESRPSYKLWAYNSITASWTSYTQDSATEADFGHLSSMDFFNYDGDESILYAWSPKYWYKLSVMFPRNEAHRSGTASTSTLARAFKVFKCKGHVLLITSMVKSVQGMVLQGFIIWKLVERGACTYWVEMSRTPHDLCLKSYNKESLLPPTFMSDGRHICAISSAHEFFPPLVYDVEDGGWYHIVDGVLKNMEALFTMKVNFRIGNLNWSSTRPRKCQHPLLNVNSKQVPFSS